MRTQQPSYVNLRQLLAESDPIGLMLAAFEEMFWQKACEWRVSIPAVVVSFSAGPPQTVTVQPAIQENIFQNLVPVPVNLPQLPNVPVLVYGAGGFVVTLPITAGDECLVVFNDMCINRWRVQGAPASGPVANQEERRRHDLSDGIAIFGLWSNPRGIGNYSTSDLQIRSLGGNTLIDVAAGQITMTPDGGTTQIDVAAGQITMTPDGGTTQIVMTPGEIDLNATTVKINGDSYTNHKHSGVVTGASNTGVVVPGT